MYLQSNNVANRKNKNLVILLLSSILAIFICLIFSSAYSSHDIQLSFFAKSSSASRISIVVASKSAVNGKDFSSVFSSTSLEFEVDNSRKQIILNLPYKEFTNLGYFKLEVKSQNPCNLSLDTFDAKGSGNITINNLRIDVTYEHKVSNKVLALIDNPLKFYISQDKNVYLINSEELHLKPILFNQISIFRLVVFYLLITVITFLLIRLSFFFIKKNKIKNANFFFVLCCVSIIFVPMFGINHTADFSNAELRSLSKFPKLTNNDSFNYGFFSQFDSYFNDRFGQRETLLKLKDSIFKINRVITANSAEGKIYGIDDNWYFVDGLLKLTADPVLLEKEKNNLKIVAQHYNCPVYIAIYPFKEFIYKDSVSTIFRAPDKVVVNEARKIAQYLTDKNNDIYAIDLTPYFEKYKSEHPNNLLYYKDDHHQTELGAYIAAKVITSEYIKNNNLEIELNDPSFEQRYGVMDLYSVEPIFMRGISYLRLGVRSHKEKYSVKDQYLNLTVSENYKKNVEHHEVRFRVHEYVNHSPIIDKTVLVVGNSYVANTGRMMSYFAKNTWQYNFMAGKFLERPLFEIDKDLNNQKIDFVVVSYFTNAVMSSIE